VRFLILLGDIAPLSCGIKSRTLGEWTQGTIPYSLRDYFLIFFFRRTKSCTILWTTATISLALVVISFPSHWVRNHIHSFPVFGHSCRIDLKHPRLHIYLPTMSIHRPTKWSHSGTCCYFSPNRVLYLGLDSSLVPDTKFSLASTVVVNWVFLLLSFIFSYDYIWLSKLIAWRNTVRIIIQNKPSIHSYFFLFSLLRYYIMK